MASAPLPQAAQLGYKPNVFSFWILYLQLRYQGIGHSKQIGHNKGIGSHHPVTFENKCTVETNREFKYRINMLKGLFGICVTCLAIIDLQLIFLITSDALTNLRNDGNDKIFILEKFSNLNHLKRIYGYLDMFFRRFNLLKEIGKGEDDDVSTMSSKMAGSGGNLAGARVIGRDFGEHLREENDETNPMVLTKASHDNRRRPATTQEAAAARLNGGDGAPVAGGERGRAAGLLHPLAHLLAAAASGGDGRSGAAARLASAGGGGGLTRRRRRATMHGRPRERGQTKEGDEVVLFIALD
uniref:Retrotransposon protein-like n=1 Tax=Oryza nivara TaxID=4536 RepID=A0A679BDV8_ORYNI|nr:retrotransposon protein-like [Oryza sativa f. spontanea]BBF89799.1 retrotransposon protein-like [Oryza sativa f. spontanea]